MALQSRLVSVGTSDGHGSVRILRVKRKEREKKRRQNMTTEQNRSDVTSLTDTVPGKKTLNCVPGLF